MSEKSLPGNALPRKKDDSLLKAAFEELFPYLLRFCFKEADKIFDFSKKFVFLDKELSELFPELKKKGGSRFVDMLVKVFLKNGKEEWILVHIEIQGAGTKDFPKRMFQYWYRIYDRYAVDVVALAIFTGNTHQKRPSQFFKSYLGTEVLYKYNVYHIFDHSEQELLAMDNPFALIVLAAQKALLQGKVAEEELATHRLTIARALIQSKKFSHKKIEKLLFFLKTFLYISDEEINRNFDEQIHRLTGNSITMGIIEAIKKREREEGLEEGWKKGRQEGRQEGREEGREEGIEQKSYEFVQNLLLAKKFTITEIANFAGVTEAFVHKIQKKIR